MYLFLTDEISANKIIICEPLIWHIFNLHEDTAAWSRAMVIMSRSVCLCIYVCIFVSVTLIWSLIGQNQRPNQWRQYAVIFRGPAWMSLVLFCSEVALYKIYHIQPWFMLFTKSCYFIQTLSPNQVPQSKPCHKSRLLSSNFVTKPDHSIQTSS